MEELATQNYHWCMVESMLKLVTVSTPMPNAAMQVAWGNLLGYSFPLVLLMMSLAK
jgi:formate/nitrite transporter FocA (FNT family)